MAVAQDIDKAGQTQLVRSVTQQIAFLFAHGGHIPGDHNTALATGMVAVAGERHGYTGVLQYGQQVDTGFDFHCSLTAGMGNGYSCHSMCSFFLCSVYVFS